MKRKRRTLSELGWFVPYHLCCSENLTETARDRLLVWILPTFSLLEVCQFYEYEQEPIITYTSHTSIPDEDTGL